LDQLHQDFRTVLSLTQLTTNISGHGHPTVILDQPSKLSPPLNQAQEGCDLILNAITAILVYKSEVIAAMACNQPLPTSSLLQYKPNLAFLECEAFSGEFNEGIETFQQLIDAEISKEKDGEAVQRLKGSESLTDIVVMPNPDKKDSYIKNDSPLQCTVISRGQSHMARIGPSLFSVSFTIPE
jgi:hypothetical protein